PLSLIWDFSWESTIGIDLFWSPPHTATYLSVIITAGAALLLAVTNEPSRQAGGVRIAGLHAPLGTWVALWGAVAFLAAVLFDRWWQSAYGLGAGIWHPPQISKAVAFFVLLSGTWLFFLRQQNRPDANGRLCSVAFCASGGLL